MSENLSDFFKLLAEEKKRKKEEFNSVVGDLGLDTLFNEFATLKKKEKEKKVKEEKTVKAFENWLYSETPKKQEQIIEDVIEESLDEVLEVLEDHKEEPKEELIEKSLGLLAEPSNTKVQQDPITPLDQKFATLDDLQKHYSTFLSRIQQQLSTVGGGGETKLRYLDDIVGIATNSSAYNGRYLQWNSTNNKAEFVSVSGGGGLDYTLGLGNTSSLGMSVGISTFNSVTVGGATTDLVVVGDARITGILTIGNSSLTLNGIDSTIKIGTGITLTESGSAEYSGVITATNFVGDGSRLTGIVATGSGVVVQSDGSNVGTAATLNFGSNLNLSFIDGIATIIGITTYVTTAGIATYATSSGIATYATSAGYASTAGIATYATNAGIATYAINSGIATYATSAGIATYATSAGIATYAINSGIATYATNAGIATYAINSGIATYATNAGIATYATSAGYASTAGIATQATKLQYARTISLSGDVVGSITFDGSGDVSIASTIQPNSVALGSDTTGDYVQSITGTSNQISVSVTSGEGSAPTLSIPNQFTAPQDVTVTRDLQVNRNLNINGNITIGGTSAVIYAQQLKVSDPDLILGIRTDAFDNDVSNDTTANHGGIAIASTEGNPLVNLNIAGIETLSPTYKKIMWFKSGTFAGLGTDAWLINYAVGIGSTQFPNGTRLAAGSVQFTENDLAVVRNINSTGVITASSFNGTLSGYATSVTSNEASILTGVTTTSTISQVPIDIFSTSVYRSAKYLIQITKGTSYHTTEISVVHDGNITYDTEYGTLQTGELLSTFNSDINAGNVRLLATPASTSPTTFKVVRTSINL
jgi:hypothetical protein